MQQFFNRRAKIDNKKKEDRQRGEEKNLEDYVVCTTASQSLSEINLSHNNKEQLVVLCRMPSMRKTILDFPRQTNPVTLLPAFPNSYKAHF